LLLSAGEQKHGAKEMKYRKEKDSMGTVNVPARSSYPGVLLPAAPWFAQYPPYHPDPIQLNRLTTIGRLSE
jgi:hypothetical protein